MNKPRNITNEQAQILMSNDASQVVSVACRIMLDTGLRISDVLNLRIEDIKNAEIVEKKTKKRKILTFSRETLTEIDKYCGNAQHGYIFASRRYDQPINRSTFYRALQRVSVREGIGVSPHSFRKRYAQNLYATTQNIYDVQHEMNHKYVETTMSYLDMDMQEILPPPPPRQNFSLFSKMRGVLRRVLRWFRS